jgi:rhodanese-related sulfurtransferase
MLQREHHPMRNSIATGGNAMAAMRDSNHDLPEKKQTTLGLYVTAHEAFEMWKAGPDAVSIIDVRTPEEYIFVGHAEMARNIPLGFIEYQWNAEEDEPAFVVNAEFMPHVMGQFRPTDTLLVMCRSGGRSALAVNALAKAGFANAYNVTDGFEGDKVGEEGSMFLGKRMKNGWKNSGSPWTYDGDPDLLWID